MKAVKSLSILIFIFCTFQLSAQNAPTGSKNTKISGQVIDSLANETIPYATLKITTADAPENAVKLLTTDADGKFSVNLNTPPGQFQVQIQYVGKKPSVTPFEITEDNKQVNLNKIYLSDAQELEEVVITAIKPLVSIDLDKITYSIEDDPDSKTNNVFDMLKKVPMVTVDGEEKIELKGSTSFKIYMDGKPSNLISNNPTQVLKSMPANVVKNIEVITDPGAKYDAEGVSGIINIITNKQPMGGYTASLNAGANSLGGYNAGAYVSMKYGKLGATVNYNYYNYRNTEGGRDTYRESFVSPTYKYLTQNGSNSYKGHGQYGYGELSYEIDTLNLLSASFNRYGGKNTAESDLAVKMEDLNKNSVYEYDQVSENKNTYGSTEMNVDYQRTFKKKDELLTASYRLSLSPQDSESKADINEILNYYNSSKKSMEDAGMNEHTFQLDYTTPLAKIHTLEVGAKYIIRTNESTSQHDSLNYATGSWVSIPKPEQDQFNHRQDILGAYLGYSLKYKSLGLKTGLRYEGTKLDAEFPLYPTINFNKDYSNFIPSVTLTYMHKMIHTFRLGYNMRIQRPGIWYLSPYVNNADPKYISQGNPYLDVEKGHNFNLNYGIFKPKFNINATLFYNHTGNSIQRLTTMRNDTSYSTYGNIARRDETGINFYGNWGITPKLRLYGNASGNYSDIKTYEGELKHNYGFQGRLFGGVQYTFPHDLTLSFNGGVSSPYIMLEGESSGFNYTSLSVNKSFLDKKLTLSLSGNNVYEKYRHFKDEQRTNEFYYKSDNYSISRQLWFSVSYRFGEMKQQIKKAQRGISNDDNKSGEGNSQGGGNTQQ